ncbi:hypothetical protein PG993_006262 [Apiospora rasikravindrae]|uniref:Uncharacterized protein n=1 Tax=Apiospora rasikravindrae TaxID=990691 RepID=A0ABR1T585_9PEZI
MSSESHELLAPQETVQAVSDRSGSSSPPSSKSPPGPASPPAAGHGKWAHIWSSWKWELLACFLVLATPLIILATLYPHAGQPLPNWPFKITINALLSIYNAVFKTSIGFLAASAIGQLQWTWFASRRPLYDVVRLDAAGRGPWGSCIWICTNHLKQPLIALGASILILSVALDPFIQQIVHPIDCMSSSGGVGQATLPRTNFFPDVYGDFESVPGLGNSMRDALAHHSSDVEANCPTGNCTFPGVFGTMGFCSSCKDSSSEISFETVCLANGKENGKNTTYKIQDPTNFSECPYSNITTLSTSFFPRLSGVFDSALLKMAMKNDTLNGTEQSIVVQTLMGKTTFSGRQIDMVTGKKWPDCDVPASKENGRWKCQGYGAATCSLYPCVRMHSAAVENGQLKERLVAHSNVQQSLAGSYRVIQDEKIPGGNGDSMITTLDAECLSPEETDIVRAQGYKIGGNVRWVPYNGSMHEELFVSLLDRGCAYSISRNFVRSSTRMFLGNYFKGQAVTANSGMASQDGYMRSQLSAFEGGEIPLSIFDAGRASFERVDTLFSNISTALTNYIRTHGNATYSADATGDMWHYSTCLEVQWPWITFHATLAVLTLLLFILVLIASQQQPVWKASPLVWILRGPNDTEIPGGLSTVDKMEKESKKMTISMGC